MPNFEIPGVIAFELEERPSRKLRRFGNGRIRITVGSEVVWSGPSQEIGVEWTWNQLLAFFVANWSWLYNEQSLPFAVGSVPLLAGSLEVVKERVSRSVGGALTSEQENALDEFIGRHDLSRALASLDLPSLVLLRTGNTMLFTTERRQCLADVHEAHRLLSAVGDTIRDWMAPWADERTQPLLDAWAVREDRARAVTESRLHLIVRKDRAEFANLAAVVDNDWGNAWDGAVMEEGDLFAAARMSSGFVSVSQQAEILAKIRSTPSGNMEAIDALSRRVLVGLPFSLQTRFVSAHEQGYALAEKLRASLGGAPAEPLDPELLLSEWGVRIETMEWADSPLDALSCWGTCHGPMTLLNTAPTKRCSHEYGRRFTLAHEICHLMVDRSHALSVADVLGGGMDHFIESRANAFAAELLMPGEVVVRECRSRTLDVETFIYNLRAKFRVPQLCVLWQIRNIYLGREPTDREMYQYVRQLSVGDKGDGEA